MNSLRMSFWIVPDSLARSTPCSSPATTKAAKTGITAPFIVIETDTLSSGMPSKRIFMSSTLSMATPRLADVALHAGVVAVVSAMGGQVEGHADPPAARPPARGGRRRCFPPPSRSPHIAGSSRGGLRTSWRARRGRKAPRPAPCPGGRCRPDRRRRRTGGRRSPPASARSGRPARGSSALAAAMACQRGTRVTVRSIGHDGPPSSPEPESAPTAAKSRASPTRPRPSAARPDRLRTGRAWPHAGWA